MLEIVINFVKFLFFECVGFGSILGVIQVYALWVDGLMPDYWYSASGTTIKTILGIGLVIGLVLMGLGLSFI